MFPRSVMWYSDRENLVNGVKRHPINGEPLNSRDVDADLWHRFAYYERVFRITATHVPRNKLPFQAKCDKACSLTRKALKMWLFNLTTKKLILNNVGRSK